MIQPKKLILASKSPRRQQILKEAGISFSVKTKEIEEIYPTDLPANQIPQYLATLKAAAFQEEIEDEVLITADTVVILEDKVMEKPSGYEESYQMLTSLSGKKHEVVTGVAITSKSSQRVFSDKTEVHFKNLKKEEIDYYISNYKPFDKAGAYGIQEWIGYIGVTKIVGSFYTVVGLPIHRVVEELYHFDSR